jgi:hypothetical protein
MAKSTFDSRTQSARTIPFIRIEPSDRSNYVRLREPGSTGSSSTFLYGETSKSATSRLRWERHGPFSSRSSRWWSLASSSVAWRRSHPTASLPDLQLRCASSLELFRSRVERILQQPVNSANLVQKVYFPRLALPLSSTLAGAVDFAIVFALLLVMMLYYGSCRR